MSSVTERWIIPVVGGVEDWKNQLKVVLQTLKKQDGYLRTRWGPCSENMQRLELLIGWKSIDACNTWKASSGFTAATDQMKTVQSGEAVSYFIRFVPYAPKEVIDASVVEVLTYSNCTIEEDKMRESVETAKSLPGCTGVASGFSLDGATFVAVVGWASVEESKAADKSLYVSAGGLTSETYHVNFRFPIKGFGGL